MIKHFNIDYLNIPYIISLSSIHKVYTTFE